MKTAILILLTANIAAFSGYFARTIYERLKYIYYRMKTSETTAAVVQRAPASRSSQPQIPESPNSAAIIQPLTPAQLRSRKDAEFRAKNNL